MKTKDRLHQLFGLILSALALLVIVRDPALAKGPTDKVTVNGPGLKREIEVTAAEALQALSVGQLEDFKSPIAAPSEVGPGYELTRYYEDKGDFIAFDHVRYHLDPAGGRDYVIYLGLTNGWSEYDGKWFRATAQGEQALQRILAENRVRLDQAAWPVALPFLAGNAEQHAIWLIALTGAAILTAGWLYVRRQQSRARRGGGVLLLLLTACAVPESIAGTNPTPETPVTATPAPPGLAPTHTLQPLSLPTASPVERQRASDSWLYLSTFQSFNVNVIDPLSGRTLHEVPTSGDRAGVGVAPDGTRLYVLDGLPGEEQLRVFDITTWQVVHQEPIARLARTFINPVALSGDGRWLLVHHYDDDRNRVWNSLFDTQRLRFLPDAAWGLPQCSDDILAVGLIGHAGHPRLYTVCNDVLVALDTDTLAAPWRRPVPSGPHPGLVLGPEGQRLYGLFPQVTMDHSPDGYQYRVSETDLRLLAWEARTGELVQDIQLSQQVAVPLATIGRGDAGYLAIAPDGGRLYVAWEDRLWALSTETLQVVGELQLPAPVDGMVLSLDGRELYLLPATSGDLRRRGHGLWTVDTAAMKLVRRASDWPQNVPLFAPLFVAAPAPETHN